MAHYVTSVRSPLAPADAFAFVADLRNLEAWDPGVDTAVQVVGDGVTPDAEYEVTTSGRPAMDLRYVTTAYEAPRSVTLTAHTPWLTSIDRISVVPDPEGSVVTYDARLRLKGFLRLGDPLLRLAFRRIGDAAAAGLRTHLDGEIVR